MNGRKIAYSQSGKNDPYIALQAAIIEQAISDYETALFFGNKDEAASLKRWFIKSEWAQALTNGAGRIIEKRIRENMIKICAMVVRLDGSRIYTNIEATEEKLKVLKKNYCKFFVDNGCFAYRTYRSFRCSLRLWEEAEKEAKKEAWRQRYEGLC